MNRYSLPIESRDRTPTPEVDYRDQNPAFPVGEPVRPPEGAPNILLILLDDVGLGASSAYGGPCVMPTTERLAGDGLRFSRFHTTALCAPTRAALITGRNHHQCGMGGIPEHATSAPGYNAMRPRSIASIAKILNYNGYATGAFGKMHETPSAELSVAGPYDRWPTRDGFERFYGFIGAETNQFYPNLIDGVTPVDPPATPEEGYHLSEDLAEKTISWIESIDALTPDRPWFAYLSFGACHDPLQVPESWRGRYRGKFAHGWNEQCSRTLAKQKELGLVPDSVDVPPWPEDVPRWETLDSMQRTVSERLMELYAEMAEHTDYQIGRVVQAIERLGQAENTLIIYIIGDNGASAEGGLEGTLNMNTHINALGDTAERIATRLDELGGPDTYPHYPVGWALAMDTPYRWAKQVASHYGGTRNGMIIRWPAGMDSRGGIRQQWHHCVDIVPTILECTRIPFPAVVDGASQLPLEGVSLAYTFDSPDAEDRHTTQYFEIFGNRGIYDRGWTAVTKHRTPWRRLTALPAFADDVWELYNTSADWNQCADLADAHPDVLRRLQEKFLIEAARCQVLPLDDRLTERWIPSIAGRRSIMEGRRSVVLRPELPGLREDVAPNVKNVSFSITIDVAVPDSDTSGVLVSQGGRFGGWSLYVSNGQLNYCHNLCDVDRYYVRSTDRLRPGKRTIEMHFHYDGGGLGRGGRVEFVVDGREFGSGRIERTVPFSFSIADTLDIGCDRGASVTPEYANGAENAYPGHIVTVCFDLGDDRVEPTSGEKLRAALSVH